MMQFNTFEQFLDWPAASEQNEVPSGCLLSLQDALEQVLPNAQTYLLAHTLEHLERNEEAMAATVKFAVARLEWLLDDARRSISGMFSMQQFNLLLGCYQGEFLTPNDCRCMASTLCHDLGIELDSYRESIHAEFIDQIRALTVPQRAALADALEVAWHSKGLAEEVLADMGVAMS